MKSGRVEYWIEVPIQIDYVVHPEEKQTSTYPGSLVHIVIEDIIYPDKEQIDEIISKLADEINEVCLEDSKE